MLRRLFAPQSDNLIQFVIRLKRYVRQGTACLIHGISPSRDPQIPRPARRNPAIKWLVEHSLMGQSFVIVVGTGRIFRPLGRRTGYVADRLRLLQ
jgi:hypothetical protein